MAEILKKSQVKMITVELEKKMSRIIGQHV